MFRKARFLLLLMMVCLCASVQAGSAASGNDNKYNHVAFQSLPALTASPGQGISAPFAGTLDDGALLVAGGCNFPDTPAADGGTKVFYNKVWLLPADGQQPSRGVEHSGGQDDGNGHHQSQNSGM